MTFFEDSWHIENTFVAWNSVKILLKMEMTSNQAEAARRNMKDFLTMYNTFTESCFNSCARNFNYRHLTPDEKQCTEKCTDKLVNINHRLISVYMEINPMNRQLTEQQIAPAPKGDQFQPPEVQPSPPPGNLADQVQQVFGEETRIKPEKTMHGVISGEVGQEIQKG